MTQNLLARLRGEGLGAILVRGAGSSFVVQISGVGINFLVHILLARVMGPGHYGIYVYVMSWVAVLAIAAKFGMDTLLVRFVSAYTANREWGRLRGVMRLANRTAFVLGITLCALGALTVWLLQARFESALLLTFYIGFLAVPLVALNALRQSTLRALKRIVLAHIPDSILPPVIVGGLVITVVLVERPDPTAPIVMTCYLVAMTAVFVLASFWTARNLPAESRRTDAESYARTWIFTALPLLLMASMHILMNRSAILLLGAFRTPEEAGIFAVAMRLTDLAGFALLATNSIAAPLFAQLYAENRPEELQRIVRLAALGVFAVTVPVCVVLLVGGKLLLGLFGPEFVEGYGVLVALTFAQFFAASCGSVGYLLTMTGHERKAALIFGGAVLINIGLNAALISVYGLMGAGIATAIAIFIWKVSMLILVRRYVGINSTVLPLPVRRRQGE